MNISRNSLPSILIIFLASLSFVSGHESCCKHKLGQANKVNEFIVDLKDVAPDEYDGQPRYIEDPNNTKPEDWSDEDDGEWEAVMIPNPKYEWKPRLIRNPNYIPPPTYWDKLQTEIKASTPWVLLGVFVTGLLSAISLPLDTLQRLLSSGSGLQAALLGLATPLCSCGALPLAAGFVSRGVPLGSVLIFLTASQSAGLDSAAITWGLLGSTAVLCRLGGAIVLAVAAGYSCGGNSNEKVLDGSNDIKNNISSSTSCCSSSNGNEKKTTQSSSTTKKATTATASSGSMMEAMLENAIEIFPTVLVGLALSTAFLHFLPSLIQFSSSASSSSASLWIKLSILVSALPLQLCEHTSVTLAATIQKAGGSPGLSFAFLLSAPATNMPTLLLLLKHAGLTTVLRVVTALSVSALLLSYAVDMAGIDLLVDQEDHSGMADLPEWYRKASPWIAASLLIIGNIKKYLKKKASSSSSSSSCCETTDKKSKTE